MLLEVHMQPASQTNDVRTLDAQAPSISGTSILHGSRGPRTSPDLSRAGWQGLSPIDRREYLTWLIWVFFGYLTIAVGLSALIQHREELAPVLAHPLTYRLELRDALGFAASLAVLLTFLMPNMFLLRLVAIVSNVLFILYGSLNHVYPVLVLHLILLPINLSCAVWSFPTPLRVGDRNGADLRVRSNG
jgi:hypothetical protein